MLRHFYGSVLPILWQRFGKDNFLFQHDSALKQGKSGVKNLIGPAQNPDLNLVQHLWDELEHQLRDRPYRPTSMGDHTNDHTNAFVAQREQILLPKSHNVTIKNKLLSKTDILMY